MQRNRPAIPSNDGIVRKTQSAFCYKQIVQLCRRTLLCLAFAAVTILLGLALRLIPVGLPPSLVKYGGSVLWAAMVYLLFAAAMPRRKPFIVALLACLIAAIVEFTRLYHAPALDAFRLTLAGKLLLGRVFNPWHVFIYWLTIVLMAFFDGKDLSQRKTDA